MYILFHEKKISTIAGYSLPCAGTADHVRSKSVGKYRGRLTRGDDRSLCNLVEAYGVFARLRLKLSVVFCLTHSLSFCAPVCASGPRMDVLNRNLTSTTSSPPILRLGSALPPLFVNWLMETGMYSCLPNSFCHNLTYSFPLLLFLCLVWLPLLNL